jgi:hypothetical protein
MNVAAGEVVSRRVQRNNPQAFTSLLAMLDQCTRPGIRPGIAWVLECRRGRPGSAIGASRSTSVTTRSFRPDEVSESFVTVTLPFHPLAGRRLRVLGQQRSHRGLELDCDGGVIWIVCGCLRPGRTGCRRRPRAGSAPTAWRIWVAVMAAVSPRLLCCGLAQERCGRARHGRAASQARRADRPAAPGGRVPARRAGRAAQEMREGGVPVHPGRTARAVYVPAGGRAAGLRAGRAGGDGGAAGGGLRAAAGPAGGGACGRAGPVAGRDACFLIDADQYGAGRRVEAQAADGPGPCPEAGIVGPVEPASHLVRARVRRGHEPADRGRRQVQAPFAQLSGKQCMRPASPRRPAASGLRLPKCPQLLRSRASPG